MGSYHLKRSQATRGLCLGFALFVAVCCRADTVLYNDGVWIVNGIDAGTNLDYIEVSVGGQPVGSFTELTVQRFFAGGLPLIYSIQADGALQPAVPPTGALGGAFHLTSYWDCYLGQQPDARIISLNIQPNSKNFNYLKFNGVLSNGTTLQATDLKMKLYLPNDSTVRLDVRYKLYATFNICIDPSHQQAGEGFQVARMASNYISTQVKDNDGANVKGFVGPVCGCCGCKWQKGGVCANFTNETGYIYPYFVWMANTQALMLHSLAGPRNTAALRIGIKKPSRKNCGVDGYTVFTTDPTEDNVTLWVNWQTAKPSYGAGQKVQAVRLTLDALLPQPVVSCDILVP
jgi:hypothetical protein